LQLAQYPALDLVAITIFFSTAFAAGVIPHGKPEPKAGRWQPLSGY
jgi:hypothetical protein